MSFPDIHANMIIKPETPSGDVLGELKFRDFSIEAFSGLEIAGEIPSRVRRMRIKLQADSGYPNVFFVTQDEKIFLELGMLHEDEKVKFATAVVEKTREGAHPLLIEAHYRRNGSHHVQVIVASVVVRDGVVFVHLS